MLLGKRCPVFWRKEGVMMQHRTRKLLLALAICVTACFMLTPVLIAAQELPIRRAILYKHGVGYFERIGSVEGDGTFLLRFKAKDMSDLLKSLTVLDLGGGSIRTIAYDSTRTVDQQLGEYTFDLRNAQGLPAILDQMKGTEISLTVGQTELAGKLLSVEKRTEKTEGGGTIDRYRVSVLLSDGKVKSYDLSDVSQVQFTHPGLQKEMEKYLEVLFSRHRRDEKQVQILATGKGKRDIFVSYVQEQPIWKVSYRIVNRKNEKPLLQAWAIVDNVSREDWDQVDLSLVSGLPVSFVQNLYDPIFVRRPEIQVEREAAAAPVPAEAGMVRQEVMAEERSVVARARAERIPLPKSAPRPDMYTDMSRQAVQAVGEEAGALFVYDIKEPVTIKRDRSALLPIVNARVEGERVGVYNESVRRENPMEAIRIRNTTGLTLEGGPVTVIEGNTYAGEALISTFKPAEERHISYAVDLGTRVSAQRDKIPEQIYRVVIANGILTRHFKLRETKTYSLQNLEDKAKTIVIEHPRQQYGWTLVDTPNPREETPNYYRFEVKVPSNKEKMVKTEFKVTEESTRKLEYRLVEGLGEIEIVFLLHQRLIDDRTRAFLEQISAVRAQIADLKRKLEDLQNEQKKIFDDQTRLRSNLQSLGQSEEERNLRSRIVRQLNQQEDRIEAIVKSVKDLQAQLTTKQNDLTRLVTSYAFETR
jgi:hypothetical protein